MHVRLRILSLAFLMGLAGFQMAEARDPRVQKVKHQPYHTSSSRPKYKQAKVKKVKQKKTKQAKFKKPKNHA